MAFKLNSFKTDEDKATNGIWVEIGDEENKAQMKIASSCGGNKPFEDAVIKCRRKTSKFSQDLPADKIIELFAEYILKDWKDVEIEEGEKNSKCTLANKIKLLSLERLFIRVAEVSGKEELFNLITSEDKEEIKKS